MSVEVFSKSDTEGESKKRGEAIDDLMVIHIIIIMTKYIFISDTTVRTRICIKELTDDVVVAEELVTKLLRVCLVFSV